LVFLCIYSQFCIPFVGLSTLNNIQIVEFSLKLSIQFKTKTIEILKSLFLIPESTIYSYFREDHFILKNAINEILSK
jgi:hypothetical protein